MSDFKIVGLCGFSRVGKDTAAAHMPGWKRFAFADPLKDDLRGLLKRIGCNLANPEHKERARQLLVAWGAVARKFQPDFWIERLRDLVIDDLKDGKSIVVTDCRYKNEVEWIQGIGGKVVRIFRDGHGPANEEEERSIMEIDMTFRLPGVRNNSTPEWLGARVLGVIE